jgi:hypothetical protein
VAGFAKIISSASNLNEAVNVTGLIFTESREKVEAFAAGAATSLGQSERAARTATATFGGLLQNMGLTEAAAADTSIQLTTLASDLGSAFNRDPEEAVVALTSALRGEQEPIRAFNVQLSDMTVRQEAVRLGLAATTSAVDQQGLVQGRLSLIMQQTSAVQGDFANTATDAANAQRIAAAEAENASASIGSNFLPVYEQGVAVVQNFARAFGALPAPLQTATVLLAATAALKGPVGAAFSAIAETARALALRFREAGGGARGLASAISPGALAVGGAVTALALLANGLAENARRAQEAEDRMKALSDAFAEGGAGAAGDTLLTQIQDQVPEAVAALNEAGVSTRDLVDAAQEGDGALEGLVSQIQDAGSLSTLSAIELGQLAQASSEAAQTAGELGDAQSANTDTAAANTSALTDQAAALTDVADSADSARDALDSLFGIQKSLDDAAVAVQATTDELSQSLRENGRSFNIATDAGRQNYNAARAAAEAVAEYTIAARANGDSVQQAAAKGRSLISSLRDTLRAAGMTKGETDRLIATYARVPRQLLTDVQVTGADAAVSAIQRVYSAAVRAASAVNQISGSLAGGGAYESSAGPAESFGGGGAAMTERWAPTVVVQVQGSVVGDVDRFADEVAYRAAEKLSRSGAF